MNFFKMIKISLIIEFIIICVAVVLLLLGYDFFVVEKYFLRIQILAFLLIILIVFLAYYGINKILNICLLDKVSAIEILRKNQSKLPFIEKIKNTMESYAEYENRDNTFKLSDKQRELSALQSQINPHFLYNTLDTIRGQALIDDNREIADMVESLALFFRYGISGKGELVTLREEIANVENYMKIQKYRFNDRFILEVFVDKDDEIAYDFFIPRLIIQPVIENAIIHGLKGSIENGIISVDISITKDNLILIISDNGSGMDVDSLKKLNKSIKQQFSKVDDNKKGTGIALSNINKRIQLLFGDAYGVSVYSSLGFGTDVEILLPINYKKEF